MVVLLKLGNTWWNYVVPISCALNITILHHSSLQLVRLVLPHLITDSDLTEHTIVDQWSLHLHNLVISDIDRHRIVQSTLYVHSLLPIQKHPGG
jgi:hypothetical protein